MRRNSNSVSDRQSPMRGARTLAVMLLVIAACGEPVDTAATTAPTTSSTTTSSTTTSSLPADPTPELMGLALRDLLTEMSTFGSGHRFAAVLVLTSTDEQAGTGMLGGTARPLTIDEQQTIESAIDGLTDDVRWVDDPGDWRTDDLMPVIPGSAIIGVGEVVFDDAGALIPVSLWCGGLCGTWFTWRAELTDGGWEITGVEGPVAIA